ncbi:MAG TPA: PIN domain-containing protein [Puia sp.]|jgi:predicted nucleic acid-binding protein
MKIFADANILVTVINKEYPHFTIASRILSLAGKSHFHIYTSPVCIAIAFYFAEKKYRSSAAKEKICLLCEHLEIAEVSTAAVRSALSDRAVNDLEDGLQYYAALAANCDCILTENKKDFYFSQLEVLSCLDFYERYMARKT